MRGLSPGLSGLLLRFAGEPGTPNGLASRVALTRPFPSITAGVKMVCIVSRRPCPVFDLRRASS
jgi:hypothetical protein